MAQIVSPVLAPDSGSREPKTQSVAVPAAQIAPSVVIYTAGILSTPNVNQLRQQFSPGFGF